MSNDKNIDASKVDTPAISNLEKIDPVWWKPDQDKKPKQKLKLFMVSFSESTKKISLDVDGEEYRSIYVKDNLSGNRKFYEGVDKMIKLFSDWGFYENQN
tara:strand:- start:41 stop:340 length:300 start_codon:yes stop_codon:yes gene_type:complete